MFEKQEGALTIPNCQKGETIWRLSRSFSFTILPVAWRPQPRRRSRSGRTAVTKVQPIDRSSPPSMETTWY